MRPFILLSFNLLLFLSLSFSAFAQDWDRYQPITFQGEIPAEFLGDVADKYHQLKDSLANTGSARERKSKDDFLLMSSYSIDDLMLSGKVMFNDPITEYLNQIKDYLLREDPEMRDKIKVYAVKTPVVNAFCTNDGIIFFTLGLLSRLENEAQAAFVLCHEFQHFIKQHPMKGYVTSRKNMQNVNMLDRREMEEALLRQSRFSRDQELEADNLGRELYLKSAYSLDAVLGLFDIMQYDYLPYEQVTFDPAWLTSGPMVIPPYALTRELNPIDTTYHFDSTRSTHPSIPLRKAAVKAAIGDGNARGGVMILLGEGRFESFRKIARYEVAHMYLEGHQYESALYQTYLLQREDPNSYFLKKTAAWALYGLAKYKNEREIYQVHMSFDDVEGAESQLSHIIENMEAIDLNLLAIRKLWEVHLLAPEDREINLAMEDILQDWWKHHKDEAKDIAVTAPPTDVLDRARQVMKEAASGSKGGESVFTPSEALARALQEGKRDTERAIPMNATSSGMDGKGDGKFADPRTDSTKYYTYALYDLLAKEEFRALYEKDKDSDLDERNLTYDERKQLEKEMRKGKNLGISKVVFVDPNYKAMDTRKRVKTDYVKSEERIRAIHAHIDNAAITAGMKHEILSEEVLGKKGVDGFNDLVTMRAWLHERFSHSDEVDMVNLYADDALALKEKYGTPNFSWIGGMSLTEHRPKKNMLLCCCLTATFPYALPVTIVLLATPQRETLYYSYTVNVETDKRLGYVWRTFDKKDGDAFWAKRTQITLQQMKAQ